MKVTRVELPTTLTVETAKQFIGRIASVCTGKEIRDDEHAESIGEKNLTEHLGGPTRAWEFLPIRLDYSGQPRHFHNARRYINNSKPTLEEVVRCYNMDTVAYDNEDFHIFHIVAPRYVMAHLKTHTTLSTLMSSIRIGCNGEKEYEFPEIELDHYRGSNALAEVDRLAIGEGSYFYKTYTGEAFTQMLKDWYKRPEITKRPLSDFELVEMNIGGYMDAWQNLIDVRTDKGVQKETKWLANHIKELINN